MVFLLAGVGLGCRGCSARKRGPTALGFLIHHPELLIAVGGEVDQVLAQLVPVGAGVRDQPCEHLRHGRVLILADAHHYGPQHRLHGFHAEERLEHRRHPLRMGGQIFGRADQVTDLGARALQLRHVSLGRALLHPILGVDLVEHGSEALNVLRQFGHLFSDFPLGRDAAGLCGQTAGREGAKRRGTEKCGSHGLEFPVSHAGARPRQPFPGRLESNFFPRLETTGWRLEIRSRAGGGTKLVAGRESAVQPLFPLTKPSRIPLVPANIRKQSGLSLLVWSMADGRWWMVDGRWPRADGGWPMSDRRWPRPARGRGRGAGLAGRWRASYLRAPRWGFLTRDCRSLAFLRFGLLMRNVPLPT